MLVSVCVQYTFLSREEQWLEFCINGWNRMLQPYTESTTALSDKGEVFTLKKQQLKINVMKLFR